MYQRDIPKFPVKINRREFVNYVFDLGRRYNHGYDTIITSVEIGDKFVSYTGHRESYVDQKYYCHDIILNLVPQEYSIELAHVVTVIAAKCNEDFGYERTWSAMADTQNRYVIKMEWEVCMVLGFRVKINNFISAISDILCHHHIVDSKILGSVFWDLSKDICMNQELLNINPVVIIMATILLYKCGKLRAIRSNRERTFLNIMQQVAHEYEVPLIDVLRSYISIKQDKVHNISSADNMIISGL